VRVTISIFALPWHAGLERKDYAINIPAKKAFYHSNDGRLVPAQDVEFPANFSVIRNW
jgi:hypothetical protein